MAIGNLIKLVDINLARNPVSRAVAKVQLRQAMIDMRIALLMMEDGENVREHITAINDSVHVVAVSYEIMRWQDSVNYRKLKSGMSIMKECSQSGFKWRKEWAITIDNTLDICVENWTKIPPIVFRKAITKILESK